MSVARVRRTKGDWQDKRSSDNISYEEARRRQVESIAARSLGEPKEFVATCAFLCSAFAGFMSGQNLDVDGGSYPAPI